MYENNSIVYSLDQGFKYRPIANANIVQEFGGILYDVDPILLVLILLILPIFC